ncbi:hypothetical protein ACLOJK_040648 [Asimina triloba]
MVLHRLPQSSPSAISVRPRADDHISRRPPTVAWRGGRYAPSVHHIPRRSAIPVHLPNPPSASTTAAPVRRHLDPAVQTPIASSPPTSSLASHRRLLHLRPWQPLHAPCVRRAAVQPPPHERARRPTSRSHLTRPTADRRPWPDHEPPSTRHPRSIPPICSTIWQAHHPAVPLTTAPPYLFRPSTDPSPIKSGQQTHLQQVHSSINPPTALKSGISQQPWPTYTHLRLKPQFLPLCKHFKIINGRQDNPKMRLSGQA